MNNKLVSIVLPIYNVEKYLNRSIKSVASQTYSNLEIILVDDGSTDNCSEICDIWAKRDHRIKVIHKKNEGLGMARNTGIEAATGEYIYFLDSDDYISLKCIERCVFEASENDADIVIFGLNEMGARGKINRTYIPEGKKVIYEGEDVRSLFLPDLISGNGKKSECKNLRMSAWTSLFSKKLIDRCNWKFVSEREIIAEDVFSLLSLYKDVNRVVIVSEAFYFYCENNTSLTHTYRKDRYQKVCTFYEICIKKCESIGYDKKIQDRICACFFSFTIAALKMIYSSNSSKDEKKIESMKILKDELLHEIVCNKAWNRGTLGRLLLNYTIRFKWFGFCRLMIKIKS